MTFSFDIFRPTFVEGALDSDYRQFKESTRQLKEEFNKNPTLKSKFNEEQLAIEKEEDRIPGFTWHHHQEEGKMQLVPTNIHSRTGHTGGRDIWGGGNNYR
ncbi:HNH endonuclease [Paludifilum halophilum]|uniref:HNH endonuclease n=1 Tax=Paludifilum halophilum TaxID=1642702 RepID=UPI00197D87AF|nr:HNH endonuclease [Paludifilum halophilum]